MLSHLLELRQRLLKIAIVTGIVFIVLSCFAKNLYSWLASPLQAILENNSHMIATEVASPFLVPFKFAFFVAIFISFPYYLYQLWSFIAPGLYLKEKRTILPVLISSLLLFLLGMLFAYFVVFPILFGFFAKSAPNGIVIMTDIDKYLHFVLMLFLAFGLAFQIPIIIFVLLYAKIISLKTMQQKRPYVIVWCFVAGMIFTPPDVFSQILLAIPMWFLFELGLLIGKFFLPNN